MKHNEELGFLMYHCKLIHQVQFTGILEGMIQSPHKKMDYLRNSYSYVLAIETERVAKYLECEELIVSIVYTKDEIQASISVQSSILTHNRARMAFEANVTSCTQG